MKELAGKTAVVTGAASGIGRALAERFAQEGMNVVLADVELAPLDAATAELRSRGFEVIGVPTDVSRQESVDELAARARDAFGNVHVLCNNAGVSVSGGTAWERTLEDWKWCFDVNFWGVLHGIRAFVPSMLEHGQEGHVVNTASTTGLALNFYGPYAVTKAAIISLTEYLYRGLLLSGGKIGASALCPSVVPTRIMQSIRNRPPGLPPSRVKPVLTDVQMARDFAEAMKTAPPATEIAAAVVAAIREGRFWILPEPNRDSDIRLRMESILSRRNPEFVSDFRRVARDTPAPDRK